jgi:hypothetical protein
METLKPFIKLYKICDPDTGLGASGTKTEIALDSFSKDDLYNKNSVQFEYVKNGNVYAHLKIRAFEKNSISSTILKSTINIDQIRPHFDQYIDIEFKDKEGFHSQGYANYAFLIEYYHKDIRNTGQNKLPSKKFGAPNQQNIPKNSNATVKTATKDLLLFVEKFMFTKGFSICVLEADSLSLAYKVYSTYYPIWRHTETAIGLKDEINTSGNPSINGMHSSDVVKAIFNDEEPDKTLITCDNTSGPYMFKLLDPSTPSPLYDWSLVCKACNPSNPAKCTKKSGGKRTQKKRKNRKLRKMSRKN